MTDRSIGYTNMYLSPYLPLDYPQEATSALRLSAAVSATGVITRGSLAALIDGKKIVLQRSLHYPLLAAWMQAMLNITMCFLFHGVTEDEVFLYGQTMAVNNTHNNNNYNNNHNNDNHNNNNNHPLPSDSLIAEFGLPLSTNSTPTSLSILRRSVPMQPPTQSKSGANASEPGLGRPTYPDILTHSVVALVNENVEQVLTWLSVHRNSLSLSHTAFLFHPLSLSSTSPFTSPYLCRC